MFQSALPKLLVLIALSSLAGCQTRAALESQPPTNERFMREMQYALAQSIASASTGKQVGVVSLKVILDRNAAPIACKARRPLPSAELLLPSDVSRSNFQALASMVEAQCWKTVYPIAPEAMYGERGYLEVVAPLAVHLPAALYAPGAEQWQYNAKRAYFWQHLFGDESLTSVGKATVYYQTDAQGKVTGCLVQMAEHPLRTGDFRLDGALQSRLAQRCMAMDLRPMPGFAADVQGIARGSVRLDYAPWLSARP